MSSSGGQHGGAGGGDVNSVNNKTPDGAGNVTLAPADIGAASTVDLASKADLVGGVVPTSQIPALAITSVTQVASEAAMLALDAQVGDVACRTDQDNALYMLGASDPTVLANWIATAAAGTGVSSVNGQTGVVVLAASDVSADASGAAAAAQAYAIQRANHTGTQPLSTISDAGTAAAANTGTAAGDVPVIGAGGQLDAGIIPPSAAPTWTAFSISGTTTTPTGHQPLRYCKDALGWVHMEGDFQTGATAIAAGATATTLPAGYRPATSAAGTIVRLDLSNTVYPVTIDSTGLISLPVSITQTSTKFTLIASYYAG
jgi:hypothetical protein